MIIFGRTRRGNLIGIVPDQFGNAEATISFPQYIHNDENFDAWIVLDFLSVKFERQNQIKNLQYCSAGLEHYANLYFRNRKSDDACDHILKGRIALALKLVAPEFR